MGKSTYLANKLLAFAFRGDAFVRPTTVYVGLFSTLPSSPSTAGTEFTTTTAPAYARVAVPNDTANWPAAVSGVKRNGKRITFAIVPAGRVWPTAVGFGIWDASTAGNLLFYGSLSPTLKAQALFAINFLAQGLTITDD